MTALHGPFPTVSPDGQRGWVYRRPMPRVTDDLIDIAVYLYPSEGDAKKGSHAGGSGFMIGIPYEPLRLVHKYIVTNKHVIKSGAPVTRLAALDGTPHIYDFAEANWRCHKSADV